MTDYLASSELALLQRHGLNDFEVGRHGLDRWVSSRVCTRCGVTKGVGLGDWVTKGGNMCHCYLSTGQAAHF